ncbi:MAG TPA: Clp protease ClpP, partial [Clostridia bacterium]|nr:Clp protease ClpP [Clostridia bacterium]
MRELYLNGYIDDEVWFGDEITPEDLHVALYGAENQFKDDVRIRLNSYGGSCNAATRMFDDVRAYPGNVLIIVSGTAASAATVLAMAADRLEMTPGSLFMIHDPIVIAWGNERDLSEAIGLLRACKESILNVYGTRCKKERGELAAMMTSTAWMDAKAALGNGFIDGIAED